MSRYLLSASLVSIALALSPEVFSAHANKGSKDINLKGGGIRVAGDITATPMSLATTPGLEISGGTSFNAYAFNQSVRGKKGGTTHFDVSYSRINFEVLGKADHRLDCLEYSFLIGLTGNTEDNKTAVEENRIKLKHRWGTFMGGVHRGVTDFMSVGGFTFKRGTGGVTGNYKNIANITSGAVVKNDPVGHGKDRTKITLITPRIEGFQIGWSFTPDGEHSGEAKLNSLTAAKAGLVTPAGKNIQEVAVNYKKDYANGLGLQLSATGLFGSLKPISPNAAPVAPATVGGQVFDDIRSYALGFVLSYAGFSFGGEYLNNGNSLGLISYKEVGVTHTVVGGDAGRMYSVALGYQKGRHGVTAGYLHSKRKLGKAATAAVTDFGNVRANVLSISYDYKLAKGLKVYAEATSFDFKQSNKPGAEAWSVAAGKGTDFVGNNAGRAFIIGTSVSF